MAGQQQQYCLKWNNFLQNSSDFFQKMLNTENLVDVTLACEGESLKCHKMVLAACSPYFQSLFISNPCKHPIVILKDVRFSDLKALIEFMYKGEVNVPQDRINSLLKTAEMLKVKGLAEVSEKQGKANQLGNSNLGKSKKRKRNRPKTTQGQNGNSEVEEEEVSEEESVSSKRNEMASQPMGQIKQNVQRNSSSFTTHKPLNASASKAPLLKEEKALDQTPHQEHEEEFEPIKLLEQSMSTPESLNNENSQEGFMVTPDMKHLGEGEDDEDLEEFELMDDFSMNEGDNSFMSLPGPSSQHSTHSYQEYEHMLADIQRNNLTVCPVCSKEFLKKSKLIRHFHTHFSSFRPKYRCGTCGKLFTTQDWCKRHSVSCNNKHTLTFL